MNRTTTTDPKAKAPNGTSGSSSQGEMADAAKEKFSMAASSAADTAREYGAHYVAEPARDIVGLLQEYARAKPDIAALWCFGLGVIVGWKLRP